MLIDWPTVFFQIVNFGILIWLLKRFLYKPILRNMDKREQRIADRLEKAREREREASREQEAFRRKNQELEDKRRELIREAEEEAGNKRDKLVEQARKEADQMRQSWKEALAREKEAFLRDLSRRAGESVFQAMDKALADLSDTNLQKQLVGVFAEKLRSTDEATRGRMKEALSDGQPLTVRSAFALSGEGREKIVRASRDVLGAEPETFETEPGMIAGVALEVGGREISWSVGDYLRQMHREFDNALEQRAGGFSGAAEAEEVEQETQGLPAGQREGA